MGVCFSRPVGSPCGEAYSFEAPSTAKLPPPVRTLKATATEDALPVKQAPLAATADSTWASSAPQSSIKAMRQPHVLGVDEENNERLNTIVELLRTTFVVDIAVLSLLEAERQWFKAAPGIEVCCRDGQTEFGSWALSREHAAMLVVEDALQDARFNTNPLVTGPPHLRFYAGAPLMGSDGSVYGMLYIADRKPRHFAAEQLSILGGFAEVCTRKLEAPRLQELQQRAAEAEEGLSQPLKRDLGVVDEAVLLCNMETEHWEIRWGNAKFAELAGQA